MIFEQKHLQSLEKNKFKILSDVREISVDGFHATLSMGVGCGADSVKDTDIAARTALDVALSRGGDQAVVLNKDKYTFLRRQQRRCAKAQAREGAYNRRGADGACTEFG